MRSSPVPLRKRVDPNPTRTSSFLVPRKVPWGAAPPLLRITPFLVLVVLVTVPVAVALDAPAVPEASSAQNLSESLNRLGGGDESADESPPPEPAEDAPDGIPSTVFGVIALALAGVVGIAGRRFGG